MFKTRMLSAAVAALIFGSAAAQAQEKIWKHGILEAKSDAGFIAMVDKGGFAAKHGLKVQIFQVKAGATLMKALISGEIDSVDMGAAESIVAGVRGAGVKIVGCTWPGMPQVVLANARMLGMNERQLLRHVYWPAALTWVFSSLHTSVGFALVGAVVGEYLGSSAGLGYKIQQAESVFDVTGVFAGMVILMVFVIVIDSLVTVIENRLLVWRPTPGGTVKS
jgi:ABC-type proline/glycine betaine transport system permease subunit